MESGDFTGLEIEFQKMNSTNGIAVNINFHIQVMEVHIAWLVQRRMFDSVVYMRIIGRSQIVINVNNLELSPQRNGKIYII